jgi:hypothetical protein
MFTYTHIHIQKYTIITYGVAPESGMHARLCFFLFSSSWALVCDCFFCWFKPMTRYPGETQHNWESPNRYKDCAMGGWVDSPKSSLTDRGPDYLDDVVLTVLCPISPLAEIRTSGVWWHILIQPSCCMVFFMGQNMLGSWMLILKKSSFQGSLST